FSTFNPYANDRSGVSIASGFVDFATGRNSIVTAPGPGTPTQVKVFAFSLMKPLTVLAADVAAKNKCPGPKEAAVTAAFMPYGIGYTGGVSLATGWVTGPLGGAEAIIVGQLSGPGTVKVYSSGSALQGGPKVYLQNAMHTPIPTFTDIAEFKPFDQASGVRVATTSTTVGADLLLSGASPADRTVRVRKFQLVRPTADADTLVARQINEVGSITGAFPGVLGGD
ncbi:MAG: copper oxidase, partial [Hyphomicrobium sp.]